MINKSMLVGVALGIGFATAGGVAAYQLLGGSGTPQGGTEAVEPAHDAHAADHSARTAHPESIAPAHADTHAAPAPAAAAPRPAAVPPVAPQPATAPAARKVGGAEECYEETGSAPRDRHRIAGTAIGAIVGGAVAKDVGDRDVTTAVGAAVGAYAGNKIQQRIQERRTTAGETRCEPVR